MSDSTLMRHAVSFWEEKGIKITELDDEEFKTMYRAWAIWAFNKLRGD